MDQYKYSDSQKTSVKIHQQPGGASQWSMGWAGDDLQVPQNRNLGKPPMSNNHYQQNQQQTNRQSKQEHYQQQQAHQNLSQNQRQPFAQQPDSNQVPHWVSYNQSSQQNQIFGQRVESGERTSVKVHNPPGGKTSLNIFGGYDVIEQNTSPARLRPKPREVQYKVGAQYQVSNEQVNQNTYGSQIPQQAGQWQTQNQQSAAKLQKYEDQNQQAVNWPSRSSDQNVYYGNSVHQPSPQRMAALSIANQGYVPTQFTNNYIQGNVRKSQQAPQQLSYANDNRVNYVQQPPIYQQQQSDLKFGGIKQTQPPGGRSQIVLN